MRIEQLMEMTRAEAFRVFRRLGFDVRGMTPNQLQKVRNRLNLKYHPDRGGDLETTQRINAAYDVLRRTGTEQRARTDPSSDRTYRNTTRGGREPPPWAWSDWSGGSPPSDPDEPQGNYTNLSFIKKRMWELSGHSETKYQVWGFDGRFFRGMFTVFGNPSIFKEMAKAMIEWDRFYETRAVFVANSKESDNKELELIYLDGIYYRGAVIIHHNSFNRNPSNDRNFVHRLPEFLDRVTDAHTKYGNDTNEFLKHVGWFE